MEVGFIVKTAGIGMTVAVLNVLLKQAGKEEYAQMVGIVGVALAFFMVLPKIQSLIQMIRYMFGI